MSEQNPFHGPPPVPAWSSTPPAKPKSGKWLLTLFILSLLANAFLFLALIGKAASSSGSFSARKHQYKEMHIAGESTAPDKIAVIRLQGIISSYAENPSEPDGMVGQIRDQVNIALSDKTVKAIIIRIDSPGGEVLASDRLYRLLKEAREYKPIVCYMGSVAASGGFYAAMGGTYVMADELTITGSIGVIMQTLNYRDLFEKVGLKTLTFKSGRYKDLLNGDREPTQDEIDIVQGLIMESYEKFYQIVLTERNRNAPIISAQNLRENLADGRIFSGKQAFENKLIDQTGHFEDAIGKAQELAGIDDAKVVEYQIPFSFANLFRLFGESKASNTMTLDIGLPEHLKLQPGRAYYLSYHLF
ncbi:signal peptide peptidase SppA [Kamptonema cortianum]|nr:signal peptide peptidase SppA [Oscillatoria laete-virens]MDK3160209.1 signal peptide peptidase SppA [Kamptonema cortianum]MDL5048439.1 signal peptide peptidase SppA [Oscillatoria amoena NRMC-F 0135]MDL5055651.1 signal peptide peptidase SppA [Oscillatoria laete-virens NRMC-F 0139]